MYLGIDLGTSNSAIVGYREGKVELYKTVGGEDILPSVIMRDRSGSCYVGKRAYDQLQVSPQGIAAKFKRLLGTRTALPFGDRDDKITPEEASAEVLRQLLKQMHNRIGETEVKGAVITVPAAFNQMQSEATIKAANAAGMDQVGLLQEPIAAALACLERPGTKSGLFLIYDLGGGTFDVALARLIGQDVVRLNHRPELRTAVLQHELDEAMRGAREFLSMMSEEDNQAVAQHHSTATQALAEDRFQVAKRAIEQINALYSRAMTNDPRFIMGHFQHICGERHAARDPARFDDLVKRGQAAAAAGDVSAVRAITMDIYSVLAIAPAASGDVAALAGLRR